MPKPESNALTLLAVLIAGALVPRMGSWTSTLAGLVLLVILFAYDGRAQERTFWQSVASQVCAATAQCSFSAEYFLSSPVNP
jgi:4-hydroxybenzoate polyprenyltransferase